MIADVVRRIGRPPLDEDDPSVNVLIKLASHPYGALFEAAQRDRVSLPEVIRRALRRDDSIPPAVHD